MRTKQRTKIHHALAIQPRDITAIAALLQANYEKFEISAACSDGSVLETEKVDDLLAFDNPGYRRVVGVKLAARTSYEERCALDIEEGFDSCATWSIEGQSDKDVVRTTSEVVSLLREAKPGWSLLTRYKASTAILVAWMLFSVRDALRRLAGLSSLPEGFSRITVFDLFNIGIVFSAVVWMLFWPIDKAHAWLFPRVFFAFGRQEDEWKRRAQWRSVVFVGFALSVVASLVASMVLESFR